MAKKQTDKGQVAKAQAETSLAEEALSHPTRVRVLGWLRHQEAKTQSEVGKSLALSNAAARYHLNVLEGADLVAFQGTRPAQTELRRSFTLTIQKFGNKFPNSLIALKTSFSCWITRLLPSMRCTARRLT